MKTARIMSSRWYILTLAVLTYILIIGAERMCMPVLFKEVSSDLGLSIVSVGAIWGLDPMAGVIIAVPGGLLADRFGVKRTLVIVCFLSGIFGALRGLTGNFTSLAAVTFLFGLAVTMIPSIASKITALWFSGRFLSLSNAMLTIAMSAGGMIGTMTAATVFSPLLGGWRPVLFLFAVPAVIMSLLWFTIGSRPPATSAAQPVTGSVPFRQALSQVLRARQVWIIGLITMAYWGTNVGLSGYLPTYLREIGWTTASADSVLTVFIGTSCVGAIPVVMAADRLRARKKTLALSIIIMTVSLLIMPVARGPMVFVLFAVAGILRSGAAALFYTMIFEIESIGSTYGGTAIGLANAIGMFGAAVSPPLGNSFHAISPAMPFIFWAALSAISLPGLIFVKEQAPGTVGQPGVFV